MQSRRMLLTSGTKQENESIFKGVIEIEANNRREKIKETKERMTWSTWDSMQEPYNIQSQQKYMCQDGI